MGRGEVAEEGGGVTEGILAVMEVGVSAMEKEVSSAVGEGREVERVGSKVVVDSEMVSGAAGNEGGADLKIGRMEIQALQ